jgi:hypothetical protein
MPDLSSDRHAIPEQLKQSDDAAERLLRGKTREQANWQPKHGTSWSMWQCFDHLARINRVCCQALLAAVEHPRETPESPPNDHARMVFEMVHEAYGAARARDSRRRPR